MIKVISNKKEIEKLHKRFQRKIDEFFTEKIDCCVGFPGGNFQDIIRYSPDLDLWISLQELDTRYWNAFGIGKPSEGSNNSINGEINFPYENINRRIAGAFAVEDNGNILILHRGKIGGGKKGVGKHLFTDNFRGDKILAIDGNKETEFCLVGELKSKLLPKQIATFIYEIKRIKDIGDKAEYENFEALNNYKYTAEHYGQSTHERHRSTTINRTHGIVVSALATELEKNRKKIGNDRNRDLFIHAKNKITTLFEIKTSSSTQNLYSVVGQLLIYSIPIKNPIILVAVLPDKLNSIVEKRFSELGIKTLYYEWENNVPKFIGLNKLFEE